MAFRGVMDKVVWYASDREAWHGGYYLARN
jgi:hypothetical protein